MMYLSIPFFSLSSCSSVSVGIKNHFMSYNSYNNLPTEERKSAHSCF